MHKRRSEPWWSAPSATMRVQHSDPGQSYGDERGGPHWTFPSAPRRRPCLAAAACGEMPSSRYRVRSYHHRGLADFAGGSACPGCVYSARERRRLWRSTSVRRRCARALKQLPTHRAPRRPSRTSKRWKPGFVIDFGSRLSVTPWRGHGLAKRPRPRRCDDCRWACIIDGRERLRFTVGPRHRHPRDRHRGFGSRQSDLATRRTVRCPISGCVRTPSRGMELRARSGPLREDEP